jgi:hypothetical protein
MGTTTLTLPEKEELAKESSGAVLEAKQIAASITSDLTYQVADDHRKKYKERMGLLDDRFEPLISSAYKTHKEAVALLNLAKSPWLEGYTIIENAVTGYRKKKEREAAEVQAKQAAEAKKRADEEALSRAETYAAEGRHEEAEAVLDAPSKPLPVAPAPRAPKLSGSRVQKTWKWEAEPDMDRLVFQKLREAAEKCVSGAKAADVVELMKLMDIVSERCSWDGPRVTKYVKDHQGAAVGKLPGIRVWEDEKTV